MLSASAMLVGQMLTIAEAAETPNSTLQHAAISVQAQSEFYRFLTSKIEALMSEIA